MANLSLYINTFTEDTGKTGFTTVGADPWLDVQDEPTNYVYTATKKAEIGDWDFDTTAITGTITSVTLYVYGKNAGGVNDSHFIWDGTSWAEYVLSFGTSYSWQSIAVPVLDSWLKINGAELYIEHANNTARSDIDAAYLYVDYVAGGTTYYQNAGQHAMTLAGVLIKKTSKNMGGHAMTIAGSLTTATIFLQAVGSHAMTIAGSLATSFIAGGVSAGKSFMKRFPWIHTDYGNKL